MKQSPILAFESSAFLIEPGEDAFTNPNIFGKALAHWLAAEVAGDNYVVGDVIAEDFGWCVPIKMLSEQLYIACSGTEDLPNHWRVFIFAERGLLARIFKKAPSGEATINLFLIVKKLLQKSSQVIHLRECKQ